MSTTSSMMLSHQHTLPKLIGSAVILETPEKILRSFYENLSHTVIHSNKG